VPARYEVIVIGVGGMGSAACYHLARRGRRVLALEQFALGHEMGSSHGISRIIRLAYFEHPSYVPLVRRAYELWRDLESTCGERLFFRTGSLDIGLPGNGLFEGSLAACQMHGIDHEILTGREINGRFPGYRVPAESVAVLQADGGYLMSERCVAVHASLAVRHGAEIRVCEPVRAWRVVSDGVRVTTDLGVYDADRLIITAGAWASALVPSLVPFAVPERQVVGWFAPRMPALYTPSRFPVFNMRMPEGAYYGVPMAGRPGLKVGRWHHPRELVDPETMDRECHDRDERLLRRCVERYFPAAAGPTLALSACCFTNSPDEHFIIDVHPEFARVAVAAGFSGHGFKFSSVVGEILADLIEDGCTGHDITLFRLARLTGAAGSSL
jgi:sarcosine oxidase